MQATANPNDADHFGDEEASIGSPIAQLEKRLAKQLQDIQAETEQSTKNDKNFLRKDTVEVVLDILTRIKAVGHEINQETEELREKLYYLTFNCTVVIFKLCTTLRKTGYAKEATHYLAFNVLCLDNNLILTTVKYLDWRILNYVELGRSYADMAAFKAAQKVIEYGITKVLYTKKIEEQDPPVPAGSKDTLIEALRILRTQEFKYMLQVGIKAEDWKKKLEEVFNSNKYHRSLAIVECLALNDVNNCHLIQRNAKHLQIKTECLRAVMALVKPDIELVKTALIQIHEKKKRDKDKKQKFSTREENLNVDELLEQHKALDTEMIKENDWKFASTNVPIEVHVELLKLCYEAQLWTDFDALLDPALVRLKFRRYETPYLATVDIQMSAQKISNIPNGFEKFPRDLNAANLRIELKKLRASAKQGLSDDHPEEGGTDRPAQAQTTAKKEDLKAKPAPNAKPDPKAAIAAKGKPVEVKQEEEKKDDEDHVVASQKELDIIQHIYVSMLLQKTKNPQNAIVGIDVILSDEVVGPDLPDSHFAVAVPIRQHTGVYEKTKHIPYIVFRRTANSLIDEEDCLSIVTDVQVLMGQDRNLRAPLGYTKIPIDLRQTPADLERVPNLDYVFICYKTDKQLSLTERDLLVFRRLAELERSFIPKSAAEYKSCSEEDRAISTTFNLDFLSELAKTIKEALLGPMGDYYLEQRRDILNDICYQVYSQYLLPVLANIDNYIEVRNQKEFQSEYVDTVDEHVIKVKNQFLDMFNVINRILSRELFCDNIIMYVKFSIYFANLLEETGDFRNAVQSLRTAINKVVEYREERMKSTIDLADSPNTTMTITVDNKKIGDLEEKIKIVTLTWKESILRKERERTRKEKEATALDEDECDEEQDEMRAMIEELKDKDLFEKDIDRTVWHKEDNDRNKLVGKLFFSEQDQIVHSLHADLLVNLYRCEVKLGKEMNVIKNQTNKLLTTQGIDLSKHAPGNLSKNLSTGMSMKMNQAKTSKTLAGSKAALKELQQTLQEAGKLPPEKPQPLSYEKILEKENNQNPYQQALLSMSLAVAKSNTVAQKSLLLEAYEYIKKARINEDNMAAQLLENSIYVSASRHFHSYFKKSPNQVYPFSLQNEQAYIKRTPVPQNPIFLGRTSTSITMKLPFYKPITEYKAWRNIQSVALYGKPSGSGVAVSLNNTDYAGTGVKLAPGHIVHVTGLIPNERYVFASGGYTPDGICVNGIGETCKEILSVLPLSLHQICGYLAEISFKLGKYEIAKIASEEVCREFVIKNDYKYFFLDCKINPVFALRLNSTYIKLISPIEAKQVAQAFLILAKTSKICKNEVIKRALTHELQLDKQKMDIRIANYLVLALEISTMINRTNLIKKTVVDLFNHLVSYFQMQLQSPLLLQILIKCHQSMRLVPQDQMDVTCRKVISCISFQIMRLGFQTNETAMAKRIIISELPINTRKWRKYVQYQIKKAEIEPVKPVEQLDKFGKPITQPSAQQKVEQPIISQASILSTHEKPEMVEERIVKFMEFEFEGQAFDEFLLSLGDYIDVVKAKTERWKLLVNQFQKQVNNGDEIVEQEKGQIVGLVEFWEGVKASNPVAQLNQIILSAMPPPVNPKDPQPVSTSSEVDKRYLEFICKCIRRAMELPETDLNELNDTLNTKVKVDQSAEEGVITLLKNRIENLNQDIVVKQRSRFQILEEKVKEMLEKRTLSGGENKITTNQLQKIMVETEHGIKQAQMGNKDQVSSQQMLSFPNEEIQQQKSVEFLWISEKYFLQGICQFVLFSRQMPQRNTFNLAYPLNCTFNDIIRLDFTKFKAVLSEHQEQVAMKRDTNVKSAASDISRDKSALTTKPAATQDSQKIMADEDRIKTIQLFLEVMAKAAKFALNSRSWLQLMNIILYTWNAFSYDLTNPLELTTNTDAWKSVIILAECSLYLLEFLQQGGRLRKLAGVDIDKVKNQKPQLTKDGKSVAFKFDQDSGDEEQELEGIQKGQESVETNDPKAEVKVVTNKGTKWFDKAAEFDVNIQASFIGYAIQCLMSVSKWESMVDISNRLNSATENAFASQLLPFIIFAQTTRHQEASKTTNDKKRELEVRIQMFENWKLTTKKKRSRQAMLTGEIPPEEQEFLAEKGKLEREIFRLEVIENVLLSDKEASNTLLENIKRDANNCVESIKACRKLYYQFGTATEELKQEEIVTGCWGKEEIKNAQIRQKRQSHKVFTNMVIASYKKCIDQLRKRQENYLLIQALHELGNLYYADNNLVESEIQWNDCVDTIFQRLYSVSQFRTIMKDNPQLADSFGSRQVMIGGVVLVKLAKLCYEGKDLHKFTECIVMAKDLFSAPAKLRIPHPQVDIEWANYCFREFFDGRIAGESKLFADKQILQPSEVLHALGVVSQALIDMERCRSAIPILAMMEYIASNVTKSAVLVTKARILKAICAVHAGSMQEALLIYRRIIEVKDLPKHGNRQSENLAIIDGNNFHFDEAIKYYNDLTPENEKNQAAIQMLQKPLEGPKIEQLKTFCSPDVFEMLVYLKGCFLLRLGENENVELLDKAELRNQLLKTAEDQFRQSLNKLAFNFEVCALQQEIADNKDRQTDNQEVDVQQVRDKLNALLDQAGISVKDKKGMYQNTEEHMCFADRQSQNLSLMLRIRWQLGKVFKRQGNLIQSFYVLRQGLQNFKLFAEGCTKGVENGQEAKEKGSFLLPEIFGGANLAAQFVSGKGGKADPKVAAPAKAAAPVKGGPVSRGKEAPPDEDQTAKAEEEIKQKLKLERQFLKAKTEILNKRRHPHIMLWLKTKIELITILLTQNRMEDVIDSLQIAKMECLTIKDLIFQRQLNQIEFMVLVQNGEIRQALNKGYDIRNVGQKYNHDDRNYNDFLGVFSELLYNIDKREEAVEIAREGRMNLWFKCRNQGLDIDPQNINGRGDVFVNLDRKKPNEDVLTQFSTQVAAQQVKGGKPAPAQAAKIPVKGQPTSTMQSEDLPTIEEEEKLQLDFTKKVKYNLALSSEQVNSSIVPKNIYLPSLAQTIRFDLRYAQYLIMIQNKNEVASKVLIDTQKLIERTLYVNPQHKFYCMYLQGLANINLFVEKVIQFQSKYASQRKYKESLSNHIPQNSIALGEFLIELPNFSNELKKQLVLFMTNAKTSFDKACSIGKNECILYEFDFSLKDALLGLSKTHFYLAEYRARILDYKYAQYFEEDRKRKIQRHREKAIESQTNDNLDDLPVSTSKDKWEEMKESKETLAIFNHKKASTHYLRAAIAVSKGQREFLDKQHQISGTNLTDVAKIPREISSELFEASQVNKVINQKLPGFEFKDKTTITSAELLSYLRALLTETRLFTFGQEKERLSKLICKLHRYLNINLSSYPVKCTGDVKEYVDLTNPTEIAKSEVIGAQKTLSMWFDFTNKKSQMFYVLGPLDEAAVGIDPHTLEKKSTPLHVENTVVEDTKAKGAKAPAKPADKSKEEATRPVSGNSKVDEDKPPRYTKKQIVQIKTENLIVHFGQVEADPIKLSQLHQDVCDLVDQMEASEKLSESCNERDRKSYKVRFESLIDRLGGFFKPLLTEEEADKDIDCLQIVKDYLPPLTVDHVKKFAGLLKKENGCEGTDPYFNAILRQFHRIRYFDQLLTLEQS